MSFNQLMTFLGDVTLPRNFYTHYLHQVGDYQVTRTDGLYTVIYNPLI